MIISSDGISFIAFLISLYKTFVRLSHSVFINLHSLSKQLLPSKLSGLNLIKIIFKLNLIKLTLV